MRNQLNRLLSLSFVVIIAGALNACAHTTKTSHADAFSKYNERYNAIIDTYDLEAFVNLYGDEPLWIAPKTAPVAGLDVPRKTFGFIIENQGQLTHTFDDLFTSDDGTQAVMIGRYDLNIEKVGTKASGTYLFVLRRDGDSWRIVVDMYNEHIPNSAQD